MKKLLLIPLLISASLSSFAEAESESFAPQKGDFSTEIQFAPFSDEIFSNGGVIQGRYFFSDKNAFIFEVGLSGTNEKSLLDNGSPLSGVGEESYQKDYNGLFQINLGYQRHFFNYKRIDLYAGFKVGFVHQFTASKVYENQSNWTWTNDGTGSGFGVNLNTGIDFYVYRGLFVGAEITAGFNDIIYSNYTVKTVSNNIMSETKYKMGGHTFVGGFNVTPLIRLGWKF